MRLIDILRSSDFKDKLKESQWPPPPEEYHASIFELVKDKEFLNKLLNRGINLSSMIAGGTKGVAFNTQDGKVLKITKDSSEAYAAFHIKDKDLKNIYKVFDVFKIDNGPLHKFYGILQEKLIKLNSTERDVVVACSRGVDDFFNGKTTVGDAEYYSLGNFRSQYSTFFSDEQIDKLETLIYAIFDGLEELQKIGIKYGDVTEDNVMKRKDGTYVLIDIGYSRSPPADLETL